MSAASAPSGVGQLSFSFTPPIRSRAACGGQTTDRAAAEVSQRSAPVATPSPEAPFRTLHEALSEAIGEPIADVVLTNNHSRILSARATPAGLRVRVHRCFEHAPAHLVPPLAVLISGRGGAPRREALAMVRAYFADHATSAVARPVALRSEGKFFDLETLRDEINHAYFDGALDLAITWGRHAPRRRGRRKSRSIRLGSWDEQRRLVRIHPVLDQRFVPRYVVASVVHHEMVHAALPAEVQGTRRLLHGPEFRRREREFHDFERAERWIATHLDRLLRAARRPARA